MELLSSRAVVTSFAPLSVFAIANAICALCCFIPEKSPPRPHAKNGAELLWGLPFAQESVLLGSTSLYYVQKGLTLSQKGEANEAISVLEEGLALFPEDLSIALSLAGAHAHATNPTAGRSMMIELLSRTKDPAEQAMIKNSIAWYDLSLGNEYLQEARDYSAEVLASNPSEVAYQGTRGAVLICSGQVEEGLRLLEESIRRDDRPHGRASHRCWLVIGTALLGRVDEARRSLAKARQEDPHCYELLKAEDALKEAEAILAASPQPFR
jgi:tetratricopeptide (TPR) repeat protein